MFLLSNKEFSEELNNTVVNIMTSDKKVMILIMERGHRLSSAKENSTNRVMEVELR